MREVGPANFPQTFEQYMEGKEDLKSMIAEGRSKHERERKIQDEKLGDLKTKPEGEGVKVLS